MSREDRLLEIGRAEHDMLAFGLLDEGQPTEAATIRYAWAMRAPFTARERHLIRYAILGGASHDTD